MTTHRPSGWNTWDFRGCNRLVYLQRGRPHLVVDFGVWNPSAPPAPGARKPGRVIRAFRWSDVTSIGPHAPLGLPARLEFQVNGVPYRAQAQERDGVLELTVTPLASSAQRVVFIFAAPTDTPLQVLPDGSGKFAGFRVTCAGAAWPRDYFLNVTEPFAIGEPGAEASIRIHGGQSAGSPGTFRDYEAERLTGSGALSEAPEAMLQAVAWNTLYDPWLGLVSSPVCRDWCIDWCGPTVFGWDTFFVGTVSTLESPELGRLNFEAVCSGIDRYGFVPNYFVSHGAASLDRSMPPIGAYLIWKTQLARPDRAWLAKRFRQLCRWHEFWPRYRDGRGEGLYAWGSNPDPFYEYPQLCTDEVHIRHGAQAAKWESGLDNSPMYDEVPFNYETNTLELDDVGLSCYVALDAEALARLARFLGKPRAAARYRREYETLKRRINEQLWDEEHGIYCNRHWDGRLSRRWSPTSFFPLLAGVAPRDRAERLVREHLLNEKEFWGRYVLPSIARNDPAYPDNDYWRGRIWGPLNFLVAEGLRRYRFDVEAAELARRGLEIFLRNWRTDGGIYENYNAETGAGGDVWNAARLYHWGGLLALVAIQELVDVEPAGYLRFGSLTFPEAGLQRVRLGGARYDVQLTGKGLFVMCDGRTFLECEPRALVRLPLHATPGTPVEIAAEQSGRMVWHAAPRPAPPARINGTTLIQPVGNPPVYAW